MDPGCLSADLHFSGVPAQVDQLGRLRGELAEWACAQGWSGGTSNDILLAVYEAMANVVTHAYPDGGGAFDLAACIRRTDGALVVTVTDYGHWRSTPQPPWHGHQSPWHGRGLHLIRALTDESDVVTNASGTTVSMGWLAHQRNTAH